MLWFCILHVLMPISVPFLPFMCFETNESNRKAMDRNRSNQKANPAVKTKTGNK